MSNNVIPLLQRLKKTMTRVDLASELKLTGKLTRIVGLKLEATGFSAPIGSKCLITTQQNHQLEAEVVGFANEFIYLMSTENMQGVTPGAKVTPLGKIAEVGVGPELLGRVIDGGGMPLDDAGPLRVHEYYPLTHTPINPLARQPITEPLDVGIRAINALMTVGRGQRVGLFAGSGVGKSVLLGMMTKFTAADVIVVGLIGERGREVKEFLENTLGASALQRTVAVVSPADTSPLMRMHGSMRALAIAEYFRDLGCQVLLLLDSLTRYAQAQRQIGLALGEPPATRGYPPSVFTKLSELVERAGNASAGGGSITAFFTVLTEGDDQQDPIADAARAILDGHFVLSRELADRGHYPALDVEASISRLMPNVVSEEHLQMAQRFKYFYSKYRQNLDLINVGAYQQGSDAELDIILQIVPQMLAFLQQGMLEAFDFTTSIKTLTTLMQLPEKIVAEQRTGNNQ